MALTLMYITNDTEIAMIADDTGVDRIWIDLEKNGKDERQKGMNTVKSNHCLEDIKRIKPFLKNAKLQVRINPIYKNSKDEIDTSVLYGADYIMLPYYKTLEEVRTFFSLVQGRVKTILLLETKEAVEILDQVLELPEIDEIHIGLNDLHLSYGLDFMFELLANGTVDELCRKMKAKGIKYGFGGIAKLGEGLLPAEYVVAEHYRLHSNAAILSRSFYDTVDDTDYVAIRRFFGESMDELRHYEKQMESQSADFFERNHRDVQKIVREIVKIRRMKK